MKVPRLFNEQLSSPSGLKGETVHAPTAGTTYTSLSFINRLQLPCLDTLTKWTYAVKLFVKDMQFVQNEYNENKHDPPLARNLPPISGKIAWSRQLYHRISGSVEVFEAVPDLMKLPETKKAVKSYNRLARVLVEYEVVYLKIWTKQVEQATTVLNSAVLVRVPETGNLHVNLDPKVHQLGRDIEVLKQMGFELPAQAKLFSTKAHNLKQKYDSVCVSGLL